MAQRQRSPWLQNVYSKHYYPSAPVLEVAIAGPKAMDWVEAGTALIDSGADATIVPSHLVNAVAAAEWDHAWLRGQWGDSRLVYQYEIDIRIGNRIFPNVVVVADTLENDLILGRDFLSFIRLVLDGPAQTVELFD